MIHDLRHAIRSLVQRPGLTLVVALTLGLGIGAATVVFALINLLDWRRPPGVERPDEVTQVYTGSVHAFIGPFGRTSYPDFEDYRDAGSFTKLAAFMIHSLALDAGDDTAAAAAWAVSGDYFEVLGLRAAAGRLLGLEDDRTGAAPTLVLGHETWRRRFGADPDAVGRTVRLAGQPFTVVGVAPAGFASTTAGTRVDVFLPLVWTPRVDSTVESLAERGVQRLNLIGRLRPGVGRGQAQAELAAIAARLDREHPLPELERRLTVVPLTLAHPIDRRNFRPTLRLLGAAATLLLLIACANVANLLLARVTGRRRELAIRQSLGAGRRRLLRQLLVESLLLALAGGFCGLALSFWGRDFLALYTGPEFADELRLDYRVLGLTTLLCAAVTLVFGLAPALAAARVDPIAALKEGTGGRSGGLRRLTMGQLLVVAQVAIAVVLLTVTGLLARTLWQLRANDLGFVTDERLIARVDLEEGSYDPPRGRAFYRTLIERAAALPGVRAASSSLVVPPVMIDVETRFRLPETPDVIRASRLNFVDHGFFDVLGVPLLQGRPFEPRDGESERGVVIVNRRLAEELWPGESPIGRTINVERRRSWEVGPDFEVIGMVESVVQHVNSRDVEPILYFSAAQRYRPARWLVVRADGDPAPIFDALRSLLRELDPALTLDFTRTLDEQRREALVVERMQAQAVGLFAGLGLALALLGVFAVLSYAVGRRTSEIGVRMALGARRGDVLRAIVGRGLALALAGVALGLAGALAAGRLLYSQLPGVDAFDPTIFTVAALVLLVATVAAAWLPARRAARVDPLVALRHE